MATIKSFTDLQQSKKLAEILPLESADMYYLFWRQDGKAINYAPFVADGHEERGEQRIFDYVPCWSLAALLETIPQEIFDEEYIINITEGWNNRWMLTYDDFEDRNHSYYGLSIDADNLVDACYEIILKLKEKNLL